MWMTFSFFNSQNTYFYFRYLDIHDLKIMALPNIISILKHLKYLDLSYNVIEVLPNSITKWVNLQTLKFFKCEKLKELPMDIQKNWSTLSSLT